MNIPNILTLIRFLLIPVFYYIYFSSLTNSFAISMVIFFIAGITDVLDGYIARRYDLVTKLGILLDPLADKLMVLTVLFSLSYTNKIPLWIFIIFLVKDCFMIAGGVRLLKYKKVISAKYYGKFATALFYLSVAIIIFDHYIGLYFLYASIFMTIFAFINYLSSFLLLTKK